MTNELMSIEELDFVIGRVVYNLFRYRKNNRGTYDAEDFTSTATKLNGKDY